MSKTGYRMHYKNLRIDKEEVDEFASKKEQWMVQSLSPLEGRRPLRYIFFDCECSQDETLEEQRQQRHQQQRYKHVPLLLCALIICEACIDAGYDVGLNSEAVDPEHTSPRCCCGNVQRQRWEGSRRWIVPSSGGRRLRFHSFDDASVSPVAEFLSFLLDHGPVNTDTIVLSHNGGRYDIHLILEELHKRTQKPKIIMTGMKIYGLKISGNNGRRIVFKDTLNYFLTKLAVLPKTFGLKVQAKPFFPYLFVRRPNLDLNLPYLPPSSDYQPEWMSEAERSNFVRWYNSERHTPFHLRTALESYCDNDVTILAAASLAFRFLLFKKNGTKFHRIVLENSSWRNVAWTPSWFHIPLQV